MLSMFVWTHLSNFYQTGKSELIKALVEGYPQHFSYSVSHTTRKPRDDETDGVQYWFCSEDQMKLDIDKGRYFEHVSDIHTLCHSKFIFHSISCRLTFEEHFMAQRIKL